MALLYHAGAGEHGPELAALPLSRKTLPIDVEHANQPAIDAVDRHFGRDIAVDARRRGPLDHRNRLVDRGCARERVDVRLAEKGGRPMLDER